MAWNDVLGHDLAKRMWRAHLDAGVVTGAYLLAGPEGIGKRRLCMEMAKALNCLAEEGRPCFAKASQRPPLRSSSEARSAEESEEGRPCDACVACAQITRQVHPDVHLCAPTGASAQIRIEDIRQLISRVALRPFTARVQVAIIDGADRLTEEAANSLLKVLEEPSAQTCFLLTTSQLLHCLPTIISRCQLIRCQPLLPQTVERVLVKTQALEPRMAAMVARQCQGSVSRAIDLAAHWTTCEGLLARFAQDAPHAWLAQPLAHTRDEAAQLLDGMVGWLRDVAVAATVGTDGVAHRTHAAVLRRQARGIAVDRCVKTALELVELRESLEQFVSPRLVAALAREEWLNLHQSQSIVHGP